MTRDIKHIGIELELAIHDKVTGEAQVAGRYVDATKEQPLMLDGDMYHKDASMLEVAMQPATCPRHLRSIYTDAINKIWSNNILPKGIVTLGNTPAVLYSQAELDSDPYASVLGCSASVNAHNLPRIDNEYRDGFRYGGMHVNIEVENASKLDALALDAYLGLISVRDWEQEHKEGIVRRRQYYGKAGEHRIKDFGIEYRTLPVSSFDPSFTEEVWGLCNRALNCTVSDLFNKAEDICHAIQECDAEAADRLIQEIH